MSKKKREISELKLSYPLGRRYEPDVRNLDWPVRSLLPRSAYEKPVTKIWDCAQVLDQGREGACVGFGFTHALIADPYPAKGLAAKNAIATYNMAKRLDTFPGENYSGTSVIAGVKAIQAQYPNIIDGYRWATTLQDVAATVSYLGPLVIGINWLEGYYNPGVDGFIRPTGPIVGGHCILLRGIDLDKNAFLLHNSWNSTWGQNGTCWMAYDDLNRALNDSGEACVLVNKHWWEDSDIKITKRKPKRKSKKKKHAKTN